MTLLTLIRSLLLGLAVLLLSVTVASVHAFIKVDIPMGELYGSSAEIYFAKVAALEADKNRVVISMTRVVREGRKNSTAAPPKETFAIQFDAAKELLKETAVGGPVVVFVGKQASLIHLGDNWLLAERAAPQVWRITGQHTGGNAFPGRTAALVRVVEAIRDGKAIKGKSRDSLTAAQLKDLGNPLVDMFEHSNWGKTQRSLGNLGVTGPQLVAADVNADKKIDLVVMTAKGVRFFVGEGPNAPFKEATKAWGLDNATAAVAAFGDVNNDGKPDLLLRTLWLNDGTKFTEAKQAFTLPEDGKLLAVALVDVNADRQADAIALTDGGRLSVFENPGRPDQAWKAVKERQLWTRDDKPLAAHIGDFGDNGQPHVLVVWPDDVVRFPVTADGRATDYLRLTGRAKESRYFPIKDYVASTPIDLNGGDGRLDLVISTTTGKPRDLVLMNRGHGAFWPNNEGHVPKVKPVALAAADVYGDGSFELLILTATGELMLVDSPPYQRGKPVE